MADAAASSTLRRERYVGPEDEQPVTCESDTVTAGDRLDEVVRRCAVAGSAAVSGLRIADTEDGLALLRVDCPPGGGLLGAAEEDSVD
jgi:hypothetical protein